MKMEKINIQIIYFFLDGGRLVVNGTPKYNITSAVIIRTVVLKMIADGTTVLEFVHPNTHHVIQVPYFGVDEYVNPKTQQIFIIFVDKHKKTILIFKGYNLSSTPKSPPSNYDLPSGWYYFFFLFPKLMHFNIFCTDLFRLDGGRVVINGQPQYNLSNPTIVLSTPQKIVGDGIIVLEFKHPITNNNIQVPYYGSDEYVNLNTQQIFIIFVDKEGRTYLIFKGYDFSIIPPQDLPPSGVLSLGNYFNE